MTEREWIKYLDANGIPYTDVGGRLRVMDLSLIPGAHRSQFDERGFLMDEKQKKDEEAALEAAKEKVKEINEVSPLGETEKEMLTMGLLNPEGNTAVPPHLESHEPKAAPVAKGDIADIDPASYPSSPVAGEAAEGNEGDEPDESADLESLTVPELKDIAEQEEVDLTGIHLKADIIKAIEKARK